MLCFAILGSITANAQMQVKGKLINKEDRLPVPLAEIRLLHSDSTATGHTAITDTLGRFQFSALPASDYLVSVAPMGYARKFIPVHLGMASNNEVDLGEIILLPFMENLSEVVIKSDAATPKLNNGNMVLRVANNKEFKTAANLYDVLRRTPGILVDQEGTITFGNQVVPVVFINGKPMLLSNQELQNYLKSLTPEMVASIEINTNPSAKYDAEYKGIIDLKLKTDQANGWKGNYTGALLQNKFTYQENNLSLSYKTPKAAYTARLGYEAGEMYYRYTALQHLASKDVMQNRLKRVTDGKEYNMQTGIDFIPNDKQRLGFLFRSNIITHQRTNTGTLFATNEAGNQIAFHTQSQNPSQYEQQNYGATLDYSLSIDKTKISFLGNYLYVENTQQDDFINKDMVTDAVITYWKSDLLNQIKIHTAQIDVTQNLGQANIDAGIKYSASDTDNNIRYDLWENNAFVPDPSRSNIFTYKEKVAAAYLSYSHKFNKLQVNAGLRMEHTHSVSNAVTIDSIVKRNYPEWLPSVEANYSFNTSSQLSASFSRKITRPHFSQLNPFRFYLSALNYWIGNPYLQPSFTSQVKIIYRQNNVITTLSFGKVKDVMTRYPLYDPETNELAFLGRNLPYRKFANLEIGFPVKFFQWWRMNYQLAGYYNQEYTPYLDRVYALKIYNYNLRLNQTFALPSDFTLNLFANYESKTGNSLYVIKSRYNIDISLQKSWLEGKLNTKFAFNDMFDTYDQRLIFREKQIIDNQMRHWFAMQQAVLTVSYNFGNSSYKANERQRNEEERRAN